MRQARIAASVLVGLGLLSGQASVTWAQARVVVPVIIQSPRVASPRASSVQITTQPLPAAPGGTSTRVTVQDTTGRLLGTVPGTRAQAPATTSSVVVELDRQGIAGPGGSSGAIGFGRRSWTVTTDGPPIEVPIIILAD